MPVQKITIIPRTKGSLGYVWQAPEEEKNLETKAELEADIVIAMGGRAAEALKFPSVTNGASNDIEQATKKPELWLPCMVCLRRLVWFSSKVSQESISIEEEFLSALMRQLHLLMRK